MIRKFFKFLVFSFVFLCHFFIAVFFKIIYNFPERYFTISFPLKKEKLTLLKEMLKDDGDEYQKYEINQLYCMHQHNDQSKMFIKTINSLPDSNRLEKYGELVNNLNILNAYQSNRHNVATFF